MKNINLRLCNTLIYKYIPLSPSYRNYSRPFQACRLAATVTENRCLRRYISPSRPPEGEQVFCPPKSARLWLGQFRRRGKSGEKKKSFMPGVIEALSFWGFVFLGCRSRNGRSLSNGRWRHFLSFCRRLPSKFAKVDIRKSFLGFFRRFLGFRIQF